MTSAFETRDHGGVKSDGAKHLERVLIVDDDRELCALIADYLRRHGPFEPHRLPMEEMEYTTLPHVMEKLQGRWEKILEAV